MNNPTINTEAAEALYQDYGAEGIVDMQRNLDHVALKILRDNAQTIDLSTRDEVVTLLELNLFLHELRKDNIVK